MSSASEPVIRAAGLTKVFRSPDKAPGLSGSLRHLVRPRHTNRAAVNSVDLTIGRGEAVAYVGANGAGKSTTVKLLAGILIPSSGTVRVAGVDPHRDRLVNARQIGVLFGQRSQLWWDLTVRDSLEVLRDLYGVSRTQFTERLDEFDEVLGLGKLLPVVARRLSLGQRMRADLAATFLHGPAIVYLDEPTIGLDIAAKDSVRMFLRQRVAAGTTILMTSHDLRDIEDVCRRLIIIDDGRIIFDGDLGRAKDAYARQRQLSVQVDAPVDLAALRAGLPEAQVEQGASTRELVVVFDRFAHRATEVLDALTRQVDVVDFRLQEPQIEDVVRRVYRGELLVLPPQGVDA
ncbi:ATP-binding cassette domain-containing protein [Plantactinospora sp. S1510]|uniref:ATP-binding cassette domain-containing protein n=1 Tax=Plantactinospora alkalitolerans TaxID=2789879 RepID=A0ABS0H168_9ACTN|nr:ATP-binding cassette domain-containing protein [Plantactinospora alkalitolerans]MBF9132201.1 ATP-binding cassette domain-containing protein [Plantactinospora alkalitolerans]